MNQHPIKYLLVDDQVDAEAPVRKYKVILTEAQVAAVSAACEMMARLGLGQYEKVIDLAHHQPGYVNPDFTNLHIAQDLLLRASNLMTGMRGQASWSIGNQKDVPDRFRVAYDVHQVLRHRLFWDKNPQGPAMTVNSGEPWQMSSQPLVKITEHEDPEDEDVLVTMNSPLSVVCPRCKAKVGDDCRSKVGAKTNPHMPRRDEARLKAATRR